MDRDRGAGQGGGPGGVGRDGVEESVDSVAGKVADEREAGCSETEETKGHEERDAEDDNDIIREKVERERVKKIEDDGSC